MILTEGGRDPKGNPLPAVEEGPFPAQVNPLRSSESVKYGTAPLTLFYRLLIGPTAGGKLTPSGAIKWQNRTLSVQGDVEPWMVNGRLHHYEVTLQSG